MALRAIALRFEGRPPGAMAGSAGRFLCFCRLVQPGLVIQGGLRVLVKQLVVTDAAIGVGTFHVGGVIERHVPILGGKREFFRSFLLSKNSE